MSIQDEVEKEKAIEDLADALMPRLAPMITGEVDRSLGTVLDAQLAALAPLLDAQRAAIVLAVEQSLAGAVAGSVAGAPGGDEIARLRSQIADQYRDFTALLRQPARTAPAPLLHERRRLALAGLGGAVGLVVLLHLLPAGLAGTLAGVAPDRTNGWGAVLVERAGPAFERCLTDARAAGRAVPCTVQVAP